MKLRRLTAALLAAALALPAGGALAAETAGERLTEVTLAVKTTLDISDEYTEFYGEESSGLLGSRWHLSWSGEDKGLTVTATGEGKVVSMSSYENASPSYSGAFGPKFPPMTPAGAKEKAEEFLAAVLTEGESPSFDRVEPVAGLSATSYTLRGSVLLNGLDTPMTFRVRVRLSDGEVTYFSREDVSDFVGDPSAPNTVTTDEAAAELLAGTLSMKLEYVIDEADETRAVLRYLPEGGHEYFVDAATGELIDLTELEEEMYRSLREGGDSGAAGGMIFTEEAAADSAVKNLSPAEQAGVEKLEGVLTQEELDAAVRKWSQLGLEDYELTTANYTVSRDEETAAAEPVTARLSYVKRTDGGVSRRYVTVNAKTGELRSVSGSNPYDREAPVKVTEDGARKKAEDFLKVFLPEEFAQCALYASVPAETGGAAHAFTFARQANGYFLPANAIYVRVDSATGDIMGLNWEFTEGLTFAPAEGIIDMDTALAAWAESYPVELAYLRVPVELDLSAPEQMPLINSGYKFYYALKTGYALGERAEDYDGVDAYTGEPVWEEEADDTITYSDLEGHWAKAALEELALYGIGWTGGEARPGDVVTQSEYLALLVRADGYDYDPQWDTVDDLYDFAVNRGLITRAQRDEDRALTRMEMVRLLLDSLGYRDVANLPGIFRCDFGDAELISDADMGYAALAQGLNMIKGDSEGNFAPGRAATRAEAATLLWQYMKR